MSKKHIYSTKCYELQVNRTYAICMTDYWLPNYTENVTLLKLNRKGVATVGVVTSSCIVGYTEVKLDADMYIWKEV